MYIKLRDMLLLQLLNLVISLVKDCRKIPVNAFLHFYKVNKQLFQFLNCGITMQM